VEKKTGCWALTNWKPAIHLSEKACRGGAFLIYDLCETVAIANIDGHGRAVTYNLELDEDDDNLDASAAFVSGEKGSIMGRRGQFRYSSRHSGIGTQRLGTKAE